MAAKAIDFLRTGIQNEQNDTELVQPSLGTPKKKVVSPLPKQHYEIPNHIRQRLSYLFGDRDDLVHAWLNAPHPELGERSPGSFVKEGRLDVIDSLIEAAESGYLG
jgi:hypothetical protein